MTAIELLKEAKEKIIELGDFFALKTDRSPPSARMGIYQRVFGMMSGYKHATRPKNCSTCTC